MQLDATDTTWQNEAGVMQVSVVEDFDLRPEQTPPPSAGESSGRQSSKGVEPFSDTSRSDDFEGLRDEERRRQGPHDPQLEKGTQCRTRAST